jgi:hypothetical protein
MIATVRCGTLVGLLVLSVACDAQRPRAPSPPPSSTPPTAPTPPAPPSGPPLTGPSTTYRFSAPLDRPVRDYTLMSSYVLYENGAFALRYSESVAYMDTGSYRQEAGRIIFDFVGDSQPSPDGQPEAIGTLDGDLLAVRYNFLMQIADLENAIYRRSE